MTSHINNERGDVETVGAVFIGLIILSLVIGGIWFGIARGTNHHPVSFKVNKTERVVDRSGGSSKYLVYTDNGVFEDTDSLINSKFNSSDLYNQLQAGKSYNCDVVGYRNGFFSLYENLIRCTEAK